MEVVLVLEVGLVLVEAEQSLLAAQEQMDQRQAQEQMQDQTQVLAVVVGVVAEQLGRELRVLAATEGYQLYTTDRQLLRVLV
jgi:hypothetical protein